tara:strand:- start:81 stop:221 length:141 start_codon:yes stop_codon:yes gene_type:complete
MKKYFVCLMILWMSTAAATLELSKDLGLKTLSGEKQELKDKNRVNA